jgi:alpha/beta superfamily hydrolase
MSSLGDGMLVDRQRMLQIGPVALDLVAYLSSGLIVGGLLCYTDDGQPRSTILHLHSGIGGVFVNPNPPGADIVTDCYSWAANHGSNVFVPFYRGVDGGQGQPELCLGEADDVANAAILLRGLDVVDPNRLAVIGASLGGCVALKAGVQIPKLRAVLAIAPPTDWAAMIQFHRTQFAPATETRCDGSVVSWTAGGPAFADMLDNLICRHPGCSREAYDARSPIPLVYQSTNSTLVVAASADTLVPVAQQLLWSALRNEATGAVAVDVRNRCSGPAAPPFAQDALLYVPGAHHLMENGPVASGLLWVIEQLEAPQSPANAGL